MNSLIVQYVEPELVIEAKVSESELVRQSTQNPALAYDLIDNVVIVAEGTYRTRFYDVTLMGDLPMGASTAIREWAALHNRRVIEEKPVAKGKPE